MKGNLNLNCVFHILRATVPPLRMTGNGRMIAIGTRRVGTWRRRRCLQCFEGGYGFPSKNCGARKQRMRD
jgi:hypothetical protein